MTIATPTVPVLNAGFMYVSRLHISYFDETTIKVSFGAARDSTNVVDIILSEDLFIKTTHNGVNGLDVGTIDIGNSYAVYLIFDSSGYQKTSGLLSLNKSSPTMPFGYDTFRRIGWICTDTSSPTPKIIKFFQYGEGETKRYTYDSDVLLTPLLNGEQTSFTQVQLYPSVPKIATEVTFNCKYLETSAGNKAQLLPYLATQTNGMVIIAIGSTCTQYTQITFPSQLDPSGIPSIKYKVGPTGTADRLTLSISGYKDIL